MMVVMQTNRARSARSRTDPILGRIAGDVRARYRGAVARLVLYGSRARGDARAGSDYDVAVFLKPFRGVGVEVETLSRVAWDIERDTGAVLSLLPFPADAYRARTLPMRAIRSEGVAL